MAFDNHRIGNNVEVVGQINLGIANTAGTTRTIQAIGSGANIGINLTTKGTGVLKTISGYAANIAADEDITNRAYILTVAKTYTAKQSFQHNGTNSAIRLIPVAGPPSTLVDGDIWYDLTLNKFRARQNGASVDLIGGGGTALLQKEEPGTSYLVTSADNGYIIYFTSVTGCNVTLDNAASVNTDVTLARADGAGVINFLSDGTSVLFTVDGETSLDSENTAASFVKKTATDWYGFGAFLGAGGGGGSGTVTSVSTGSLSPLFTASIATATSTPALSFALSNAAANSFFVGPTTGSPAGPTYRAMVTADIPDDIVTLAKLIDATGAAIIGKTTTGAGNFSEITAASDNQVLRRSGTSIGFGAVNLSSSNAITGMLGITNGGTGLIALGSAYQLLGVDPTGTLLEYKTAMNGLTATGGAVSLGGTLTISPTININGQVLLFTGGTFTVTAGTYGINTTTSGITFTLPSITTGDMFFHNSAGFLARIGLAGANRVLGANNSNNGVEYKVVSNGLTAGSTTFRLGGALVANTSITGAFSLSLGTSGSRLSQLSIEATGGTSISAANNTPPLFVNYNTTSTSTVDTIVTYQITNPNAITGKGMLFNHTGFNGSGLLKSLLKISTSFTSPTNNAAYTDYSITLLNNDVETVMFNIDGLQANRVQFYGPVKLKDYSTGSLPTASNHDYSVVYDTDDAVVKYSDGSTWISLGGSSGGLTDGDYGDVIVGGGGTTLTVDPSIGKVWTGSHRFTLTTIFGSTTDYIDINPISGTISRFSSGVANLYIQGDFNSSPTGNGGAVVITSGGGGASGIGGEIQLVAGSGGFGYGRLVLGFNNIQIGQSSDTTIAAGFRTWTGNPTTNDGQEFSLSGGDGYSISGNGNGGNIVITSGLRRTAGSGKDGNITIDARAGRIIIPTIPTSSAGLTSGMVWANSNVLTRVP